MKQNCLKLSPPADFQAREDLLGPLPLCYHASATAIHGCHGHWHHKSVRKVSREALKHPKGESSICLEVNKENGI